MSKKSKQENRPTDYGAESIKVLKDLMNVLSQIQ